jgi:hypothetical protein
MNKNIVNFKDFMLNEKKSDKKVYFFHPKSIFDTRAESQALELINIYFDNPFVYNTPEIRGSFYKFVDDVNTVIILPYVNGLISPRTFRRLTYSFERGYPAFYIHPKKYKIIKIENLEFFEEKTMSKDEWQETVQNDNIEDYFTDVEDLNK